MLILSFYDSIKNSCQQEIPRAFTWIKIDDNGSLSISVRTGPAFQQTLQRSSLPKSISNHGMTITRDILALS